MKNEELQTIAETGEITFDDIIGVMQNACEERVLNALEKCERVSEEIVAKLSVGKCTHIACELYTLDSIEERLFNIICMTNFEAGEVEGISVAFSARVTAQIREGVAVITDIVIENIVFNGDSELTFDAERLEEMYWDYPELFVAKCFCD